MRARYYNVDIKRFINQDVIEGSITNSPSLNKYAYCQGNPVSLLDPFGLSPQGSSSFGWHLLLDILGFVPVYSGLCSRCGNICRHRKRFLVPCRGKLRCSDRQLYFRCPDDRRCGRYLHHSYNRLYQDGKDNRLRYETVLACRQYGARCIRVFEKRLRAVRQAQRSRF